ncbi:MAG: N-formylglutamate amidohydrolase [Sorangiineae bacterium]|nr:N-formylglutamate amidohydrolase [Polyangiaceae bacterium]MEB2323476.1 N-formylglutamate amidohydrolase [Sorangiineae bacterium]
MKTFPRNIVVSCEHGGNRIPAAYAGLFRGATRLLASHRGWDAGALVLARELARALSADHVFATTSRLLVDLNRSPGHPAQFSEFTRALPREQRDAIARRHHAPYRRKVTELVARAPAVHLSVHSFTPIFHGEPRRAELGLLYDPSRARERALADALALALAARAPELRVRRNYPYRGTSDGLAETLRRALPPAAFIGLELELSQAIVRRPTRFRATRRALIAALVEVLRPESR